MRASILKAIARCCNTDGSYGLDKVVLNKGYIYASDSYVIVRLGWFENAARRFDGPAEIDVSKIRCLKPSEDVDPIDLATERVRPVPDLDGNLELAGGRITREKFVVKTDPGLLCKVAAVFREADVDMEIEDRCELLAAHGVGDGYVVDAIVMNKRRQR